MSKKKTVDGAYIRRGLIELYSLNSEFIKSQKYRCVSERKKIVESWGKMYPFKKFYINIIPEDYENKN